MAKPKTTINGLADSYNHQMVTLATLSNEVEDTDYELSQSFDNVFDPVELKKKQLQLLSERKTQVQYILDGNKLQEALKIIDGLKMYSELIFDVEVMNTVKKNIKTPMDMKFLTEAYKTMSERLTMLTRLDTVDSSGTSTTCNLAFEFNGNDGSSIKFIKQGN